MYSYEDRLRAVELYIKLGKRVRLTVRQLGHPTKNALKGWCQAYARDVAMPAGYARQPRYTQAQQNVAVEHYRTHGRCVALTIRELGYPSRTLLAAWVQGQAPSARVRIVGRFPEASAAIKQSAVIALCMRQASARSVAKDDGVSRPTLYKWKHQLLGHDTSASIPRPKRAALEQQVEALRRNIRHLQLEQDLLKKANELLKNPRPWLRRFPSVEKHRRRVGVRQDCGRRLFGGLLTPSKNLVQG